VTDDQFVSLACNHDRDAVALVHALHEVCHLWDDIHDEDKPMTDAGMWAAMFDIPSNPFYQRHFNALLPALKMAALSWMVSERMESGTEQQRAIAHVTRHSLTEVYILISELCGGRVAAALYGPQWWERAVRETTSEFLAEMEAAHEPVQNA